MIITTCWILWIPVAVDVLVDPFDRGDPLDEQPTNATTTTTTPIPTEGKRIRRTLRARAGVECAAT
jgi:hypothetical protein